ncbi:MAG: 2OG-Fe dioxygenase family protein [Candidatus Sungbacteria bacterium]|nr:2OG-Fe dioxygenase family protein [Candidatus Sungbacteria bacterium]
MTKPFFGYLADEAALSAKLGSPIGHPVRMFDLGGLGVNRERFISELAPTFSLLSWDEYDVKRDQVAYLTQRFFHEKSRLDALLPEYYAGRKGLEDVGDLIVRLSQGERWVLERIRPRRKRAIARLLFDREPSMPAGWRITRRPADSFSQNVESGDARSFTRAFKEISEMVTGHPDFQHLLGCVAEMIREVRPAVKTLSAAVHQVSIFADADGEGTNAPEGIHQDGADYIISALVVERDGVIGGESIVYGPDKKTEYLRACLQPGQGLFQQDRNSPLWHDVTSVQDDPKTPPTYGKRSIFGFDIDVKE